MVSVAEPLSSVMTMSPELVCARMGAVVRRTFPDTIEIDGRKRLRGADHEVVPDRIEAGTFIVAAGVTGGHITLDRAPCEHLGAFLDALDAIGLPVHCDGDSIEVEYRLASARMMVRGIKVDEVDCIRAAGFDPDDVLAQASSSFFNQVFRDGFKGFAFRLKETKFLLALFFLVPFGKKCGTRIFREGAERCMGEL